MLNLLKMVPHFELIQYLHFHLHFLSNLVVFHENLGFIFKSFCQQCLCFYTTPKIRIIFIIPLK